MAGAGKPRWSTGREDTRAIFRDGQCVGRMNETEVAAVVVRTMNGEAGRAVLFVADEHAKALEKLAALRAELQGLADGWSAGAGFTGRAYASELRQVMDL